jgi:prepilin-type N-terminal cleavage/methylation domain-containing protein
VALALPVPFDESCQAGEGATVIRCAKTDRAGFTIVEILMVIALIGLVAMFAIPKLDFSAYRINGAVRGVTGLLARAQRLAVTNQYDVNVLFDVANNSIKIHEDADNDNTIEANEQVLSYPLGEGVVYGLGGAPTRLYTPAPISFTRTLNGMPEIIFRRDGSVSENGGFYITSTAAQLNSRPKDGRSIEVIRSTGRAEWYQYNGSAWVKKF